MKQQETSESLFRQSNLTRSQFLIWTGQMLNPELPLYNMAMSYRLKGPLNSALFNEAFDIVVAAGDAMRLTIVEQKGIPYNTILTSPGVLTGRLLQLDFSGRSAAEELLEEWIDKRRTLKFELDKCLFDSALIKIADDEHVWYYNQHHLATDGWSIALVYQYVTGVYQQKLDGSFEGPPEIPAFGDYITYEGGLREKKSFARAIEHWQEITRADRKSLNFFGKSVAADDTSHRRVYAELGAERTAGLKAVAATPGFKSLTPELSLYNVFATLMFAFLHRLSGSSEVAFGAPAHNRSRPNFKKTIGVFIEMFPMRAAIEPNESFLSLGRKVVHEALDFLKYAQPGASNANLLNGFNAVLNFIHARFSEMPDLQLRSKWIHPGAVDRGHGLQLQVHDFDNSGSIQLLFDFNRDIFDDSLQQTAIDWFLRLADSMIADCNSEIATVDLLDEADRRHLLVDFNRTGRELPLEKTVLDMFEAQAQQTPAAPAILEGDNSVGYAELNRRAEGIAAGLAAGNAGTGNIIAICCRRSVDLLAGILGILKSGNAYLAIEPGLPARRKSYMIQDSRAAFLLAQQSLADQLPEVENIIFIDTLAADSGTSPDRPALPSGNHLAYLLYTSGSTGKPKGVMVGHRSLSNYLSWAREEYVVNRSAEAPPVMPLFSTISADLTVTSMFLPLICGGAVCIYPEKDEAVDLSIMRVIQENRVNLLKLTPSHLAAVVDTIGLANGLKTLILGGEDLKSDLAGRVSKYFDHNIAIFNEYGPTEATVGCMTYRYRRQDAQKKSVPIGRPIANTRIYLLDGHLNPVPPGAVGEIYIGGAALAHGYHRRPELTAGQFLADPFLPGQKMYRSGDRAKFNADGLIEFLGRADDQLKIRGFRIELAEIEEAVLEHPDIRVAAVTTIVPEAQGEDASPGVRGEIQLAAYYVAESEIPPSELREFLSGRLSDYMIPAHLVYLKQMPLNATGKIDRKNLPRPRRSTSEKQIVLASSSVEKILAEIWATVLGIKSIGINDNFFDLGGDSIHNIQIVSKAARAGIKITPGQLFQHQTIAELASVAKTATVDAVPNHPSKGSCRLTPIQHWFFDQDIPNRHHWHMGLNLVSSEPLDQHMLQDALAAVCRHHDVLRLRFSDDQKGLSAAYSETGPLFYFHSLDLAEVAAQAQPALIKQHVDDLQQRLNIESGPLLGMMHFRNCDTGGDRLNITIHHLAVDGISWSILLDDLGNSYRRAIAGEALDLPPRSFSYQHWANALVEYGAGADITYWEKTIDNDAGRLPADDKGEAALAANLEGTADTITVCLDETQTENLLRNSSRAYKTRIDDLLLTALTMTLSEWRNSDHVQFEREGHGRDLFGSRYDLSRTLGWFTAISPMNLRLPAQRNPGEAIKSIKEQLRAVPLNGAGFSSLAGRLENYRPADLLFNYLGQLDHIGSKLLLQPDGPIITSRDPGARRTHPLEIHAFVTGKRLEVNWIFSKGIHSMKTIKDLAEKYRDTLIQLVDHCMNQKKRAFTASDFPMAGLSGKKMNKLSKMLAAADRGSVKSEK